MNTILWNDRLSVGIDLIDDQHKTWLQHLNNVSKAIEDGHRVAQISKTLQFLVDYTELHFSTEEKNMTALAYPALAEHREKHESLKVTLSDLVEEFEEEGATHILAKAIDTFLGNWLFEHIQNVDQLFAQFVKEKGVELSE
jgi:hemerythrin-like metal-binding protein